MRIPVDLPELNVAFFSFLLHFVWEMWQAPFFAELSSTTHWAGVSLCTRATLGDSAMAVVAFWTGAMQRRTRSWFLAPTAREAGIYLGTGLAFTIAFEWLATGPLGRWTYGPAMPRVPLFGTGLLPILQWLFVPPLVLWLTARQLRGRTGGS